MIHFPIQADDYFISPEQQHESIRVVIKSEQGTLGHSQGPVTVEPSTHLNQCLKHLPDELLKLPEVHSAHMPADVPPQPLRYWPAVQDDALHAEQAETPDSSTSLSIPKYDKTVIIGAHKRAAIEPTKEPAMRSLFSF